MWDWRGLEVRIWIRIMGYGLWVMGLDGGFLVDWVCGEGFLLVREGFGDLRFGFGIEIL